MDDGPKAAAIDDGGYDMPDGFVAAAAEDAGAHYDSIDAAQATPADDGGYDMPAGITAGAHYDSVSDAPTFSAAGGQAVTLYADGTNAVA